ncbi:acyltransferase family protein [Prosthecomicrobium sp. N25]|uniref:acyltransferase family protein n=1 Tax=Prosthecomicrobium sp. N25 TaxID=3129254 RepID=UPI003076E484
MSAAPSRVAYLDGLRGLAALGVALGYHVHYLSAGHGPGWLPMASVPLHGTWIGTALYEKGWALVDVFFVLSGVVFSITYRERIARREICAARFAALRFSRLYPVHAAAWLLVLALACLPGTAPVYPAGSPLDALAGLLLLVPVETLNYPAWSITVEAVMYGLFFVAVRWPRRLPTALLAALGLGLIVLGPLGALGAAGTHPYVPLIGRGLLGFFAAAAFWPAWQAGGEARRRALAVLAAAAVASLPLARAGLIYPAVAAWTLALLALLDAVPRLRAPLESRPLLHLGRISLSLYLMQLVVYTLARTAFAGAGATPPIDEPWFLLALGLALVLAGDLTHRLVEEPARAWLRGRDRPPAVTPAATSSA